jgi:hypothetical protein
MSKKSKNKSHKRPFGIALLSILQCIVAVGSILSFNVSFPIFNKEIDGVCGSIMWICFSMISLYLGYGLWFLKKSAWWLAVGISIFSLISISTYYSAQAYNLELTFTNIFILVFLYLFFISVIVYLIKVKSSFESRE